MAGKRKTKCPVIASLVLSVIAAVVVWIHIGMAADSVGIDAGARRGFYDYDSYDESPWIDAETTHGFYDYDSHRELQWIPLPAADWALVQGSLAVGCLLLILGLLEFVAAVWCSVLGCRVACCCKSTPTNYLAGSQQVVYINSAYPNQPGAVGAIAPTSAPPYVLQTMIPNEEKSAEMAGQEAPPSYDNPIRYNNLRTVS